MLGVLSSWNRWGRATLNSGVEREVMARIVPFLHSKEVVALVGPRRAGKTTVLFKIMDMLEQASVPQEAMLHVNFEEPAFSLTLGLELLDTIYQAYREEIYPEGTAYLFLDEIQNVPGWERWVRARSDTENH